MFHRIGTAIVGGVAGLAIGLVAAIATKYNAMDYDRILMMCGIGGAIGLVLGFALAEPPKPPNKAS